MWAKTLKGSTASVSRPLANPAVGVEFYSWDFDYKDTVGRPDNSYRAEVVLDMIGRKTGKFKPSLHFVAVKVVDNDGLESVEVLKLKVNGKIERQP